MLPKTHLRDLDMTDFNMESIAYKTESPVLSKMEELYEFLKKEYAMLTFQTNDDIVKMKEYSKQFKELEELLFEETGIQFRFYSTNAGPHCIVPPGPSSNIISHQSAEISRLIKRVMTRYKIRPENKAEDIKALKTNKDLINLYATLGASMNEIEKSYFGRNVKVDFKKGKIEGLNKDVVVFIGMPFIQLFRAGFTVREIMAITYHEIGHGFNSIAYMHQYFTTVNTTIEGLYEAKGEKEVVDAYNNIIAIDGKGVKDIKEMFYDLFSQSDKTNGNVYAIKNNESMADQFAVRHGLGKELVEALARLTGNLESDTEGNTYAFSLGAFMAIAMIAVIITAIIVANPILLVYLYIMIYVIYLIYLIAILAQASIASGLSDPQELSKLVLDTDSIYDDLEQRFKRVKFDLIRQLKDHKVKNKKDILTQIDTIDALISKVEEDRGVFTNLKYIFTMKRRQVGISDFYMSVEELMENDIHARNEAFKRIFK